MKINRFFLKTAKIVIISHILNNNKKVREGLFHEKPMKINNNNSKHNQPPQYQKLE